MTDFESGRSSVEGLVSEGGGRRGIEDIMASILGVCRKGERKTKIMYGSMLNLRQVNRYLQILVEKGLVMRDKQTSEYRTTVRGARYLKDYEDMIKNSKQESSLHKELVEMLLDEATAQKRGGRLDAAQ